MGDLRVDIGDVVWCHCENTTRDGGMCSEGFCSPDLLDPSSEWDIPLIREHIKMWNLQDH